MINQIKKLELHPVSPKIKPNARFIGLPSGSSMPSGWLQDYARLNADAWLLHYARSQDVGVYGKFWNRNLTADVVFDEFNQTLTLCDYTAYFADGLVHYSRMFPDSKLAVETGPWLEKILASQDADGYIGAFEPQARWQHWLEIFSQAQTFEALLYWYEYSGDKRFLEAVENAAKPQMDAFYRPAKNYTPGNFSGHGTIIIRYLSRLYALTGNKAYLDFAVDIFEKYGMTKAFLQPGDAIFGQHNAVGGEHVGLPAMLSEYSGEADLLVASKAAWEMLAQNHLSVDGTPHGNEAMQFKGPLHNTEHCGTIEWFLTSTALARITGEVKYADAAEKAFYNAYPAAKSPDGMMVAYMHTPNQLVASEWSQPHAWTSPDWCASRQHYHSAHEPLCCNVNGPRGIPYFVESMIVGAGEGLAVMYYGPCQVETVLPGFGQVGLQMDTDYPFEDQVVIQLTTESGTSFPLRMRIPTWCSSAHMTINEEPAGVACRPGTYALVDRIWQPGDRLVLKFEYAFQIIEYPRSEFGIREAGYAIQRGPLVYALPVKENWQDFTAPSHGPGTELRSCRVMPAEGAAWNFAVELDLEHPEKSLQLVKLDVPTTSRPWENSPLGLRMKARRVLNWHMEGDPEHPKTPLMPYRPMSLAQDETDITLVPFGFTHLRMTFLPIVEAGSAQ